MTTKYWQIIRDDSKKTYEVCGQTTNDNAFANKTVAMQRAKMNVSYMSPPVTNKTVGKDLIKIVGYTKEDGLMERLSKQYLEITLRAAQEW